MTNSVMPDHPTFFLRRTVRGISALESGVFKIHGRLSRTKSCKGYLAFSSLIPLFTVTTFFAIDEIHEPFGLARSLAAGILAGLSGAWLYSGLKIIKHRLDDATDWH